jgi:hypothetical protein
MSYITTANYETVGLIPETPGILYGQYDRLDEINDRIFSRTKSDTILQPNFDPRPIQTKYSMMPIIDRRVLPKTPVNDYLEYSSETNFSPVTSKGPVDGFLRNVDTESSLRSQFFALQRDGAGQSIYIPGPNSDLYRTTTAVGRQEEQTHPGLFVIPNYEGSSVAHLGGIGNNLFFNPTRQQLREPS